MLKFAALAVAVMVAGPSYTGTIEDRAIEKVAQRAEGTLPEREHQALSALIQRQWIEGEAKERGVVLTPEEVDAEFESDVEQSFRSRKDFKAFLRRTKQTEDDIKATMRSDLLSTEIKAQITEPAAKSVTPDQVRAYVDVNPELAPERRTVRVVETKNRRQAIAVMDRLRRGAKWSSVGGTLGRFDRSEKPNAAARAIFKAELKRLTRYGRFVFKVIRHTPAKPLPRAQQEAMAWELLASQAQQRALDEFTVQFTAKWRGRTTCAPKYGQHEDCGQPPSGQQGP